MYRFFGFLRRVWIHVGSPFPRTIRFVRYTVFGKKWPVKHSLFREAPLHKERSTVDVAVIIPCHNYAHFLVTAIESVLAQTVRPSDILVVDDASDDATTKIAERFAEQGVKTIRTELRNLALVRNAGAKATHSTFLLYLDADDSLPVDYLERCLDVIDSPKVGLVYTDRQEFGERSLRMTAPPFSADALEQYNYISSNALIRRQAFDMVGGYRAIAHSLEDWDFHRRVIRMGYVARHAATFLNYRIHADSMNSVLQQSAQWSYANAAALPEHPVTIFTPFAGRVSVFQRYLEGLLSVQCQAKNVHLFWYNTSPDPAFDQLLRKTIATLPFGSVTYRYEPLPEDWQLTPTTLIKGRISKEGMDYYYQLAVLRAYNTLIQACKTEYVLTVEDDIRLAPDTLIQLQEAMDGDVAAVIAPYRSGFYPRYEVWKKSAGLLKETYKEKNTGIEEVGGSGFGCTLFRMGMLRNIAPLRTAVLESPKEWYDQISYRTLAQYGRILCNWNAAVEHMQTERYRETLTPDFL
jgi:glycosyltransferase involved in cell wall biosynthesis